MVGSSEVGTIAIRERTVIIVKEQIEFSNFGERLDG